MEVKTGRRRVVLVPVPAQGHITPMMQLGKTLHSKGFSITVAQTKFNYLTPSDDFSDFQFVTIPEALPETDFENLRPILFLLKLNKECQASFKDLLLQHSNDISRVIIIYDEFMYFAKAVAKEFNLPNVIFSTTNATTFVCRTVFEKLDANNLLAPLKDAKGKENERVVPGLHPLRYKDLPTSKFAPLEKILELCRYTVDKQAASCVIINTASCLESSSLSRLQQQLDIPVYPVGPLHMVSSAPPSSLLEEDKSCIEWLDKQERNSVIFVSLGSLALMETNEVMEMASGLDSSKQHFLWVIKPGSVVGCSEWIESLPEEFSEMVWGRGYVVKWAPQKEVLAHPAVGGFWSHCGWNSTLESIGEGVPVICRPCSTDQKVNARYLDCVWRAGIQVEGEVDRGLVERVVKRLMVGEEGEEMRKRAVCLKERLRASVGDGGSSHNKLHEFVQFIKSL